MKAITYTEYGAPEVLQLNELGKPSPKDSEVLVRICAASVNYSDWAFVRGKPFLVRLMGAGLFKPKLILGADIAGCVEALGGSARQFQPGDEVFGDLSGCGWGGFAEYVAVPEHALALKPSNLTFQQTAAVPQAALVALQGLRDKGRIESGQKVLITGASGGIGSFAVQIAKSFSAKVTGVCSTRNLDRVRSMGADEVIDYTQEDFAKTGQTYDLILATAGYRSVFDYRRALSPKGIYVETGGAFAQIWQAVFLGPLISMTGTRKMRSLMARPSQKDMQFMKGLIEAGKVVPVIDRAYPLSEAAVAIRYYGEGHAQGKVIISVEQDTQPKE
jgi:NADPH:quinone reductase-like Zn-dependent oxidoreductase